jgi:hypothetical protein
MEMTPSKERSITPSLSTYNRGNLVPHRRLSKDVVIPAADLASVPLLVQSRGDDLGWCADFEP